MFFDLFLSIRSFESSPRMVSSSRQRTTRPFGPNTSGRFWKSRASNDASSPMWNSSMYRRLWLPDNCNTAKCRTTATTSRKHSTSVGLTLDFEECNNNKKNKYLTDALNSKNLYYFGWKPNDLNRYNINMCEPS